MGKIRIVACPPGQAPEDVREAWVGLEIPLSTKQPPAGAVFRGAVDKAPIKDIEGYAVSRDVAVRMLRKKNPKAAKWWRKNARWLIKNLLIFPKNVCQLV